MNVDDVVKNGSGSVAGSGSGVGFDSIQINSNQFISLSLFQDLLFYLLTAGVLYYSNTSYFLLIITDLLL